MKHFSPHNLSGDEQLILEMVKKGMTGQTLDKDFKNALLNRIAKQAYPNQSLTKLGHRLIHKIKFFFLYSSQFPAAVTSLAVIVLTFGIATSYAYLSPQVTREDNLYVLKKLAENVQYTLSIGTQSKVEKNLSFADRRKEELQVLYKQGRIDEQTAKEITRNLAEAYALTSEIDDPVEKKEVELQITSSSKKIIGELNDIIQDIEQTKEKVKVKRYKPSLQEFKKELEQIKTGLDDASMQQKTPPVQDQSSSGQNQPQNPQPAGLPEDQSQPQTSCTDECTSQQRECYADGYRICGNFDQDTCTEWGQTNTCPEGQSCQVGQCQQSCTNDCISGSRTCSANGYRICGDYDSDQCTEWNGTVSCTEGQSCSNGVCYTKQLSCTDECSQDSRMCASDGFKICGNYDTDSCFEWGEVNACPPDTTCKDGTCSQPPKSCTDECQVESNRQCQANAYQICGNYDADECLEWGEKNECPSGTSCGNGVCQSSDS